MILKKLFWATGLKSEDFYYFFIGFIYSLVGIGTSIMIFSQNIGLAAVFLISLAAISQVDKKLSLSEKMLGTTKSIGTKVLFLEEVVTVKHTITLRSVFEDHKNLFKIYFFLFMGIMLCFSAITLILPIEKSSVLFGEQFKIISGKAFTKENLLVDILLNNTMVLLTGLFLAILFEYGTTFIIVWNATVWGTAFAVAAKQSFLLDVGNPTITFTVLILLVFTYLPFEAAAYFASSIAGGLLNKAMTRESISSIRFKIIATHAVILLGFGMILLGLSVVIEVQIIEMIRALNLV
ncbi:MAG: hypothetical protein HYW50_01530 [Candidatus Diapherotrites archaeon]|nr:hypothetical protein [Candidatus Diapherotrites archaeon]